MAITRRGLLKFMAATGATIAADKKLHASEDFPGYPEQYGVLYDTSLCIGCRSCEEACNSVNKLPKPDKGFDDETVLDVKRRTSASAYTVVNKYMPEEANGKPVYVKSQCMHCSEPACFAACLAKAFTKTPEGAVKYNPDVCIGCRYCMQACPFNIPAYEYHSAFNPRVVKCTMCHDRILAGGMPGCVEACPMEALTFGKRKDLIRLARKRTLDKPGYQDHIFGENEMGGTSWLYISKVPFEKIGFNMNLGVTAAPKMVYWFLWTIPLWHISLTALLAGIYTVTRRKEAMAKEEIEAAKKQDVKNKIFTYEYGSDELEKIKK